MKPAGGMRALGRLKRGSMNRTEEAYERDLRDAVTRPNIDSNDIGPCGVAMAGDGAHRGNQIADRPVERPGLASLLRRRLKRSEILANREEASRDRDDHHRHD